MHEIKKEGKQEDEITTWVFEGFTPTAKLVNGKAYSIISDHIGKPIQAIDDNGELVWSADYDIYGRLKNVKGERTFIPFRQAGQIEDAELEGLYYNRYRWYNSETGIYISQDPIGLAGNNPTLYEYVFDSNIEVDILGLATVYLRNNEIYVGKAKQNAKTRYKSDKVNSATDIFTDIPDTDTAQGVEDVVHDRLLLNKDLTDKVKNINKPVRIGDKKGRRKDGIKWLKQKYGENYLEEIDKKIKDHYSENGNGCKAK
ncbi:RHS repeat domain-containing protein [Treponema pedis]|uniref:RHS repeat domain-containing protein n=1 Tax=Treponema pedis TaxID=409322 RepID=UPI0011852F8D|nr:RHS repeat-associated core domain-containing protein [Treponema pedis]